MMRRFALQQALWLAAIAVPAGHAQDEVLEREVLARCARIAAGAERLACYDAAVRWIETQRAPPAEPPAGDDAVAARRDAPGDGTGAPNLAAAGSGNAASAAGFGAEQLGGEGNAQEEIHSRLIGEFTGWDGNTRFPLENGQVWQQIERGRVVYRADGPQVTIRRAAMGTYLMTVEGVRRAVRVRRIQ